MSQTQSTIGLRNGVAFRVSVAFDSDWACSTGTSRRGAVDRCIDRDQDRLPVLRGKTLLGLVRDAAETVAAGLDADGGHLWRDWLEVTFGGQSGAAWQPTPNAGLAPTPAPAALIARTLRLPEAVRAALKGSEVAREATVLLRPGVRIDERTGVAVDDMFRIEERASAGLVVEGDWRLRFPGLADEEPVPWEAEFLLRAAMSMVDSVGGKRRRGAGRCTVRMNVAGCDDTRRWAALLDQVDQAEAPAATLTTVATPPAEPAHAESTGPLRHRHDLRITLRSPLLVPRRVIGNMVFAAEAVPGTSLVPMLARALGAHATELITRGLVVITDATLEINEQRSLPVPRALQASKDQQNHTELANLLRPKSDEDRRLKPRKGFCVFDGDGAMRLGRPSLVSLAHAVVNDESQRPDESSGGFYVYEAIAAGTVLRAEIWLPDGVSLDESALTGEHALGRSQKDDYGQVELALCAPDATSATSAAEPAASSGELVVWLTADLLMRGELGEATTSLDRLAELLGAALGVRLSLPEASGNENERPAALVETRRIDSWQTRWSLPRPSLVGLAGGSVIRFDMHGTPSAEAMRRVQAHGVGERTAEGFGRVLLQPPPLLAEETIPLRQPADGGATPVAQKVNSAEENELVRGLLLRGWSRELHQAAMTSARDEGLRMKLVPKGATAAQLGTIRTLADRLAADRDATALLAWTRTTRGSLRRDLWKQLLTKLEELAKHPAELWQMLDVTPPAEVAAELHLPALARLLAEVARTEAASAPDKKESK